MQDVFNPHFLSLSHQILGSKARVFSASGGRRATDWAMGTQCPLQKHAVLQELSCGFLTYYFAFIEVSAVQ